MKPCSTNTEDSQRLETLNLDSRCNVLCREIKGADQRCGCHAADLHLYFSHMQKAIFLMTRLKCTLN